MSKHDLQARPIYRHRRDSIEARLTIVFAALAVSRWIEDATGWTIRKFVRAGALPDDRDPRRRTHPYRCRPPGGRRQRPPRPHPPALKCALILPNSGYR
jgi:hypothetical protein